jgi:hypothetical protein
MRETEWPPPRPEPPEEPSHPWARHGAVFDWDRERARQKREGPRWTESEEDRREREASIRPRRRLLDWIRRWL